jgi:PmbA protein
MDLTDRLLNDYSGRFDAIEFQVFENKAKSVEIKDREVEDVSLSASSGMKVRVFKESRILHYVCGGIDESAVRAFLEESSKLAGIIPPEENLFIPESAENYIDISEAEAPDVRLLEEYARETEQAAFAHDKRVKSVKSAAASYIDVYTYISGTHIYPKSWNRQIISSSCHCLAGEDGDLQEGFDGLSVYYENSFDPSLAGKYSAGNAVSLLGGKALKTGAYHILLDSGTAAQFVELISEMCDAENVLKKMSMLEGKEGAKVASKIFTLVDDPFRNDATGSFPYDDEGTPAQATKIIGEGTLEGFLHNGYTARMMNRASTGNAVRTGSGKIGIGASNLVVPATASIKDLPCETVIKVTDVMGLHTADTVSGDFSVGIAGTVLKNGVYAGAFRENVLSGSLKDLLKAVINVYDNSRAHGNIVTGDILFDKMTISGS